MEGRCWEVSKNGNGGKEGGRSTLSLFAVFFAASFLLLVFEDWVIAFDIMGIVVAASVSL